MEWWSWFGQVVETIVVVLLVPVALWQLKLQRKATQDQTNATLRQTIATIITWVQSEAIRESRTLLFELETAHSISQLSADKWEKEWKLAADRVSHTFNSAALMILQDPKLEEIYIRPTRRAILVCWKIVQPRIIERRKQQEDLWREFDQLAEKARKCCKPGEEAGFLLQK